MPREIGRNDWGLGMGRIGRSGIAASVALVALVALLPGAGATSVAAAGYCVGGTPSAGIDLDDVTFGVPAGQAVSADDCWGADSGDDDILAINALAWDNGPGGTDSNDWVNVARTGTAPNGEGDLWLGEFRFDVSNAAGTSDANEPWSYSLTWFDTDPSNAAVVAPVDMVFVGAQSGQYAAWLFRDIAFFDGTTGGGTFRIDFTADPGFAHASIYVRHSTPSVSARSALAIQAIPEPDVLGIFGLGLGMLGLGLAMRRR